MREESAPYTLLGSNLQHAPQSNLKYRLLKIAIVCFILTCGGVFVLIVSRGSSMPVATSAIKEAAEPVALDSEAEYVNRNSWMKDGCQYYDKDLLKIPDNHGCEEFPKQKTKNGKQQQLGYGDADIALDPTDFDFSMEDFDYSRCPHFSTLKVFVPRVNHPLAKALAKHPAATLSQREACVHIEFADGQNSDYSPRPDSSNLLVVNLNPSSTVTATGPVMIAQARYAPGKFRANLDFAVHTSVGAFDVNEWKEKPFILPVKRQMFAAYISELNEPTRIVNSSSAIQRISCTDKQCAIDLSIVSFCILSPSHLFQAHLLLALHNGCIPVVMSLSQPLPFQDQLDWKLAVLRFPHSAIGKVREVLATLSKEDILEMRRRATVFRRRLDNANALARSLLAAVAERMQLLLPTVPMSPTKPVFETYLNNNSYEMESNNEYLRIASPFNVHQHTTNRLYSYDRWNSGRDLTFTPRTLHDVYGLPSEAEYYDDSEIVRTAGSREVKAFARGLGINREPEQFTVLLMTYHRDEGVKEIIAILNNCPYLNKVLVVWNNVGRDPPGSWPKIHVPVEFIRSERNSLNNRFMPYDRIETEAVFSIDDDMAVNHDELVYAFKVWRQNRDRIVGFVDRYHSWWEDTSKYGKLSSCEYSMLLDSYFVAHKEFFYEYTYNMHPAIRQHVDDTVNCGDIAFNYLVSHLTRKPPMKIQKIVGFWNSKSHPGLSGQGDHYRERDGCVQKYNAIYGYNPLLLSQMKAAPVMDNCVRGM